MNFQPVFPLTIKTSWNAAAITAANNVMDGTGTVVDITPVIGANGAKVDQILVRPLGTNVVTVMRFFLNNGQPNTNAANNCLMHEVTMPATTASANGALAGMDIAITKDEGTFEVPIPVIPAGHKLFVTIGTAVAAGFKVSVVYGEY